MLDVLGWISLSAQFDCLVVGSLWDDGAGLWDLKSVVEERVRSKLLDNEAIGDGSVGCWHSVPSVKTRLGPPSKCDGY